MDEIKIAQKILHRKLKISFGMVAPPVVGSFGYVDLYTNDKGKGKALLFTVDTTFNTLARTSRSNRLNRQLVCFSI